MVSTALLTPIRVRGKRHGQSTEKYTSRPRRSRMLRQVPVDPDMIGEKKELRQTRSPRRVDRNRSDTGYAALERLPPELIQSIFIYSSNLDLPAASRALFSTLSNSKHLQLKMMDNILSPILQDPESKAPQVALSNATRLFNSRFVTWEMFTTWMKKAGGAIEPPSSRSSSPITFLPSRSSSPSPSLELSCDAWSALKPSPAFLLPRKLLHAPFTTGKTNMLTVLSQGTNDLLARSPLSAEVAHEGLAQAVKADQLDVVKLLFDLGLRSDLDLLCTALAQETLNPQMVQLIVAHSGVGNSGWAVDEDVIAGEGIDLLDPRLWRAAEKRGAQESEWLVGFLKEAQRRKERNG